MQRFVLSRTSFSVQKTAVRFSRQSDNQLSCCVTYRRPQSSHRHGHMVTDLCVEDREGLRRVEWDENPDQELLVFSLQGQSKAVDDAERRRRVTCQHFHSVG